MAATPQTTPVFVRLLWIPPIAMVIPSMMALIERDHSTSRAFLYSALMVGLFTLFLEFTTRNSGDRSHARSQLFTLFATYSLMPIVLALPLTMAMPMSYAGAWFEMVSSITTTGGTLLDQGQYVPRAVHLWRGMIAWGGGLFALVTAVAVLAPMNLGGFEVRAPLDLRAATRSFAERSQYSDPATALWRYFKAVFPVYAGLTFTLFIGLMIAGDDEFVALMHAMAVLSTSGVSPVGGLTGASSGFVGEAMILLFFVFAIARSTMFPTVLGDRVVGPREDPELRLGLSILIVGFIVVYMRHWVASDVEAATIRDGFRAFWGTLFTAASFLSTTGFESENWFLAAFWSGLKTPGLALVGFAMIGGGVATTAGGVKLMRVYALSKHMQREVQHLILPHAVGGKGVYARRIRQQGAYIAWVLFMMFAMSLAVIMCALGLAGVSFETAMVLSVAALSNCGPLAMIATETPVSFANIPEGAQVVLAGAMVAGRLEALALIALANPELWRK